MMDAHLPSSIPLDQLHFGHEADPPLNPRRVGRNADLETLAASLLAHGQGQAVNVRTIKGEHFVFDGNRRLAALRLLVEKGKLPADHSVKVDLDDGTDAGELSLALNLERVAMHEADTYVAFQELAGRGLTDKQIASRFGLKSAEVRKMLALGALHEVILDAWREDKIRYEAATAFTLAKSLDQQAEIYRQLAKTGRLQAHSIREAFGANDRRAQQLLTFIGMDVYTAAGGRITRDLFGDNHVISDVEILQQLVDVKLQSELDRLTADGWSWVSKPDALPDNWYYNWETIRPALIPTEEEAREIERFDAIVGKAYARWQCDGEDERLNAWDTRETLKAAIHDRSFTAEHKASAGAVVTVDHESKLSIKLGVKKPGPAKKTIGPTTELSNALMNRLSVQLTLAMRDTLPTDARVGLAALASGLAIGGHHTVRISASGMAGDREKTYLGKPFAEAFVHFSALSLDELIVAILRLTVDGLDATTYNAAAPPMGDKGHAGLANALPPERMNTALRFRFDAADYFAGASKTVVLRAIGEALDADQEKKAASMKKAELVKFAVANVPPTRWLPPELRTTHYDGPTARSALAAKTTPKPPKKKPAKEDA